MTGVRLQSAATSARAGGTRPREPALDTRPIATIALAAVGFVGVLVLFHDTVAGMVRTWWVSETFTHGFLVLPLVAWLLYRDREKLLPKLVYARPDWPVAFLAFVPSLLWLLGHIASIVVVEQIAVVLMLITVIVAILGRQVARHMAVPLLFLLFLAPVGEELVPVLMSITADLTVAAVRLTGIPVFREGLFFALPSGNWSVVEACSGIRYLIASIMLGALFAHLVIPRRSMQLVFIALSATVPILANAARAYLIVMIGHLSDNELAAGADHLVYGWLFFGVVMLILFAIGNLFTRVDTRGESMLASDAGGRVAVASDERSPGARTEGRDATRASFVIAVLVTSIAVGPVWWAAIDHVRVGSDAPSQAVARLPFKTIEEKELADLLDWAPQIAGHDQFHGWLRDAAQAPLTVALRYAFVEQRQGKEMISSANVMVRSGARDGWRRVDERIHVPVATSPASEVVETRLQSADGELRIWHWFRVGDATTVSPVRTKALELLERLRLRNRTSALEVVATSDGEDARARLAAMHARLISNWPRD